MLRRCVCGGVLLVSCLGPFTGAQAQDNGGMLAVPERNSSDILSITPQNETAPRPRGDAALNVTPMQVKKESSAQGGNLNIRGDKEKENPAWWMDEIFYKLPITIQDELTQEAGRSQQYCEQNFMLSNFYDCECYGAAVLKDLTLNGESEAISYSGPDERFQSCIDPGRIAGFAYTRCQESLLVVQITDSALEETCACTARALVRDYRANPIAEMNRVDQMYTNRLLECQNTVQITGTAPPQ